MMRRGPGLVRTMARTAVVAGTASAVAGSVHHHQAQKYAAQEAEAGGQGQMEDMQAQIDQLQAQQAQGAVNAASAPPAAAPGATDLAAQLQQLQALKTSGVLSEAEFEAAKAKILGG